MCAHAFGWLPARARRTRAKVASSSTRASAAMKECIVCSESAPWSTSGATSASLSSTARSWPGVECRKIGSSSPARRPHRTLNRAIWALL
eukprot:scaffold86455_cov63-Phaeocystis_antarctica.AAC.2